MENFSRFRELGEGLTPFAVILRICLAVLCGGVLGIERGKANQAAGMRTYILVCLGAALVMMTGQYMFVEFNSGDPARLGAQVVSGIGFLGAGSIIVEGHTKVRGLTTAAGLWTAACIGLSIGIGFYLGAIISTAFIYLVVSKFKVISNHFTHNDMWLRLYVEFKSVNNLLDLYSFLDGSGMQIGDVVINDEHSKKNFNAIISVKNMQNRREEEIVQCLQELEGIKTVKIIY
ncbi:magnesium transporter MgtC [Lachnoclostridium sp. An169]|uniref:MgtC/SapB family protein n=1 Tax=Lachnoclostridium sp. An169 TaxID=1965569 RepID=UPI000B391F15|nr:magnesium transporter MgtC [Lachnoclostridium sp. An169]